MNVPVAAAVHEGGSPFLLLLPMKRSACSVRAFDDKCAKPVWDNVCVVFRRALETALSPRRRCCFGLSSVWHSRSSRQLPRCRT